MFDYFKKEIKDYEEFRRKIFMKPYRYFDIYSIGHIIFGMIIYKYGLSIQSLLVISLLWELFEQLYYDYVKYNLNFKKDIRDDFPHAISDVLYNILGYYIAKNYLH